MPRDEWNRPRYHFTPPQNWMNDPNGLVYHDGEYHLFYQYNPYETHWGHMCWGHAVSPDLVHWQDLPIAILEQPEKGFTIFSGSAVMDARNTSGFGAAGNPPLVAVYTADYREPPLEDVHISFSVDRGRTFADCGANPVLHVGDPKFGDPKVFWDNAGSRWIMVTILGARQGKVALYGSQNLTSWRHLSDFEAPLEAAGVWECPDLFPLPVDGDPQRLKWVLKINVVTSDPTAPRTLYFVGDFDGAAFRRDAACPALTPEHGPVYAEVTYNGIPAGDGRRVLIGWIRQQPSNARSWTGMQSIARSLSLHPSAGGWQIRQEPVAELNALRFGRQTIRRLVTGDAVGDALLHGSELEILADFEPGSADECGLRLHAGSSDLHIGYTMTGELFIRRSDGERLATALHAGDRMRLHVFIDRSVVEVFGGEGQAVLTALLEPDSVCETVQPFARGGAATVAMDAWKLGAVW